VGSKHGLVVSQGRSEYSFTDAMRNPPQAVWKGYAGSSRHCARHAVHLPRTLTAKRGNCRVIGEVETDGIGVRDQDVHPPRSARPSDGLTVWVWEGAQERDRTADLPLVSRPLAPDAIL
jgi:hypothetical protein